MNESLGGPTREDLDAANRRRIGWGAATVGLLLAALGTFFFGYIPADRDYKRIKEQLCITVTHANGSVDDLGCQRVVPAKKQTSWLGPSSAHALIVNAGETALRDCFGGTGTPTCTVVQAFKYHGLGTSATAVAETDVGCTTELTTQYNPDSTRATGSQTNNGANVYRTVGTNSFDATATINEFCLMSQAATGGGTAWTHLLTGAITVNSGDSVQTTYDGTFE